MGSINHSTSHPPLTAKRGFMLLRKGGGTRSLRYCPCFRLTPYEWENPHPCVEEPEELENVLTLHNCFWHNWGSLMQQGSDIAPKYVARAKPSAPPPRPPPPGVQLGQHQAQTPASRLVSPNSSSGIVIFGGLSQRIW